MNIVAIIQARCNSSRLKDKVLADLDGEPLIERVLKRIKPIKIISNIVVATSHSVSDDRLVEWCKSKEVDYFRGSELNVLERYYHCAKAHAADVIVRVTADDPFKDPLIICHAINLLKNNNYDYVSNTIEPTYPEGIDIEVFKFKSLEVAFKEALLVSEKEHVTPYIWKNSEKFSLFNFKYKENLSHLRWTIDYLEDLEFARAIYQKMRSKKKQFLMHDILNLLSTHPEISEIQKNVVRNEGYLYSKQED